MAEWEEPVYWTTGQKLRARDLNHDLNSNIAWLKNRPYDLKIIYPQAANINLSNTAWGTLGQPYQLEVVLPDTSNVLLLAALGCQNSGASHKVWFDWVRDGEYWLSSATGAHPSNTDDGIGEIAGTTAIEDNLTAYFWDTAVPAGRHTYDFAIAQVSNSIDFIVTNRCGQLLALVW